MQELLLTQVGEIPDLLGNVEKYYAVGLTDAPKIGYLDIQRIYKPYIHEKQKDIDKHKREQENKYREQNKEKKLYTEKVMQKKLFEAASRFSASDPPFYFAKIEYYKSVWCEETQRYVYLNKSTPADAVILGGVIYLGGWKPKNKKTTSKGVKIIEAQPGTLYNVPKPYCDIINQHSEIEEWQYRRRMVSDQ